MLNDDEVAKSYAQGAHVELHEAQMGICDLVLCFAVQSDSSAEARNTRPPKSSWFLVIR